MSEPVVDQAEVQMAEAIGVLEDELRTLRASRASPALVEKVEVETYGDKFRLIELAQITAPEKDQLLIQPYDAAIVGDVKKAIEKADLGLNPVVNGTVIRIVIPPLTEERRQELVKTVRQRLEGTRIIVRQIRQQIMEAIEKDFKGRKIGEDKRFRLRDLVQKVVDEMNEEIEKMGKAKEEELMTV
jgi:ribosome recycling factor